MTKKQTILDILRDVLSQDPRLMVDDRVSKNKVVELAYKMDKSMLQLLVANPDLRQTFLEDIDGILVFDANKFQRFVNNKQFLPDSYTVFKNKIGLATDDEPLMKRSDVVLVFPYKDCVLEGGQDKQDAKRDEVFYSETLAHDDITCLYDPKVLTNFTRIDATDIHEVEKVHDRDNLLIKGNNLIVLKCLERKYWGRVKLIYIDPPYNTGSDSFGYNDRFHHSTWLVFMKNRLETAWNLLRGDGVIFISCDDNEQAYLKVLCDEIFGRENFIAQLIWQQLHTVKNDAKNFSKNVESILVFAKCLENKRLIKNEPFDKSAAYKLDDGDGRGPYKLDPLTAKSGNENNRHPFTFSNGVAWQPPNGTYWRYSYENLRIYESENKIVFNKKNTPMFKRHLKDVQWGKKVSTLWQGKDVGYSITGDREIKAIFDGVKIFKNPKPTSLIKKIIQIASDKDSIILDFFAGSGTTGHAVLQQNHEDGGTRQFMLIEQLDEHIAVCEERLTRVMQQHNHDTNFVSCELMKLNQEFVEMLQEDRDLDDLLEEMKSKGFVTYKLNLETLEKEFGEGNSEEKRLALLEMLDKNHLYLNLHDMIDTRFDVSAHDQRLNRQFYHLT